jgi:hypothetical protein
MKQLKIKVWGSLLIAVVLSFINFDGLFLEIVLCCIYGLFKIMDMYHEVSNQI